MIFPTERIKFPAAFFHSLVLLGEEGIDRGGELPGGSMTGGTRYTCWYGGGGGGGGSNRKGTNI